MSPEVAVPDDSRLKPDFAVHLDGKKLEGEEAAAILGIRVYQTRSGASAFEIVVSDPELRWQGKPTFTDCKEVKIELGVPGKLRKIFDGEVTAWRTELERTGPSVLVLRGMDRAHRMMRAKKTMTYAQASPLDCAKQIAGQYGLTAKTRAASPEPVKMFRFQANQTDYEFLSSMAELEGYLFWVEGSELHFERPELSDDSDVEFSFGEDLKTFQPVANFRKPPASVEVGAWDASGKAEITGKAKTGDELWSVPGGKPGSKMAKFTSSRREVSLVESRVGTQEHADTVARAALTRRAMEFITAEVEVQGDPAVKPGAMVNLKKVGAYSGHYLITEANHFYDGAGYNCIFYVARDKWGDSSSDKEKDKSAKDSGKGKRQEKPYQAPRPKQEKAKNEAIDFTLQDDQGNALADVKVKIRLPSGEVIAATTDGDGHVHVDDKPAGAYTVEIPEGVALTTVHVRVEDAAGDPVTGAPGTVTLGDGTEIPVMTDSAGEVHLTDVPAGEYTFKLDGEGSGLDAVPAEAAADGERAGEGEEGKAPGKEDAPPRTEPIRSIAGPERTVVGREARYSITRDERTGAKRKEKATWEIEVSSGAAPVEKIACAGDDRFVVEPGGMTIKSVPGQWSHRRIAVRAYVLARNDRARVESAVAMEPMVIADSWTNPDASGHRPGIGPDFASGDMSERQYRDIGTLFNADFVIPLGLGSQTDDQLFQVFRDMAVGTFSSGELVANTNAMIDKFKRSEGGEYSNEVLTRHAREHESTRRFVTNLRGKLAAGVKTLQGDAGKLSRFARIPSPVYGSFTDKFFGGLTIAVNDTWAYEVELTDFELTGARSYRAKARIHLYDHFGLDKADLEGKGISGLAGFRAWLLLQRVRGYKPFVTKIEFEEEFEDSF